MDDPLLRLATGLDYWGWWILGLLLGIVEAFLPGMIFIWMGLAAGIVGVLLLLLPLDWRAQWLLFAVLSLAMVAGARLWLRHRPLQTDRPALNRRGEQYVGRNFTLPQGIVNGHGRLVVDDTSWRIEGPDLPSGAQVRVVGADGTTLKVEAA